jgi:hypothetical protein
MKTDDSWLQTDVAETTQPPGGFELGSVRPSVQEVLLASAFHRL